MSNKDLEDKLRKDFRKALMCNKCGDVVDDLISILKRDYILMVKEPLYCKDCFNCNTNVGYGFLEDSYCKFYQKRVSSMGSGNGCEHYLSGVLEARKSVARLHNELTGDLFYE